MLLRLFSITLAIFTSACSTLLYQEPTTGSRARVRFVSDSEQISVLRTYEDKNCTTNESEWMRLANHALLNSHPKRLGMPLWNYHDNAAKEVYVEANKSIYALFTGGKRSGATNYSCGVPFWYSFEDGADYEVRFRWAAYGCRVTVAKIDDGSTEPEFLEQASFSNRVNEENKGCLAAFKKQRLY
jgi:hypothetical protein